jgi:thiamine kinase-like enzyme
MQEGHTAVSALANVQGFGGLEPSECEVTRLGGLTNLVYRVEARGRTAVVRVPGKGTEAYIDRDVEIHNAICAERAGVSPRVLWADAASGILITDYIDASETMTPSLFMQREGAAARAGQALARLHGSGQEFRFRFELFSMIDDYLQVLSTKDVVLPEGYHDIVAAAEPVKQALAENPVALVPSHCDPLCENFLDDGTKMWVVDWEYSGMNDPMWDLGDLSVEGALDGAREDEMLRCYFGGEPTPAQKGRVVVYKAMCDLLWTLWGLIQHADGNPAEDFWAYSMTRFERCKALMQNADFARHLEAMRNG